MRQLSHDIELPPSGKKISFNLLDDEDFTITYITDTILNSPAGKRLPSQAKRKVWIIDINVEEPITDQGVLDELNRHKNPCVKSKVNIGICRRKSYYRTNLEEIRSIFDQFRPVVSHPGVHIQKKYTTSKNIGEGLKIPQRQLWKEALFVEYEKNRNFSFLLDPIPIKSLPKGKSPPFNHCS